MAKPNYAFEKRQRELQKKQKKAEKGQRKLLNPETASAPDRYPEPTVTAAPEPQPGAEAA